MRDEADIGLVDPEGRGGDHHVELAVQEALVDLLALAAPQIGVVRGGGPSPRASSPAYRQVSLRVAT